jgi:hypothetical protein
MSFRKLFTPGLPQGLLTATLAVALLAGILAVSAREALADGTTVLYTGQGFTFDGATTNLNDQRCGAEGEGIANDGGTGQFANWNGPGLPYEPGQPYLVWVLTANGATSAHLYGGPFGPHPGVQMFPVGGTFKYASQYFSPEQLINIVAADYIGGARGNVQLTVSHGCPVFEREGAWCSPGFWKNAKAGAYTLIGVDPVTKMFNGNVSTFYYGVDLVPDVALKTVLDTPPTYSGSPVQGTGVDCPLNAFNATGAYLTDLIPGFTFSCEQKESGSDTACPIDHFGNFKE